MPAQLIDETQIIDVSSLSMLLYGAPGTGKTYLAQTADDPITLDFDRGAHRASNRRAVMRFDSFADIAEATKEISKHKTVVVDTIGRLLDLLTADIVRLNAKHGSAVGGLSLQGFGALKARFATWVNQLRLAGKDLVFICHEKEEKDGDDRIMRPDIQGGSYTEVMKFTDLVGYVSVDRQGRRLIDFNPNDRHLGKNAAGWDTIEIPKGTKTQLGVLFSDAKKRIGQVSEASAAIALAVEEWAKKLDPETVNIDKLNGSITDDFKAIAKNDPIRPQVWQLLLDFAAKYQISFDAKTKKFVETEAAA